jgi:hypothetical protein
LKIKTIEYTQIAIAQRLWKLILRKRNYELSWAQYRLWEAIDTYETWSLNK